MASPGTIFCGSQARETAGRRSRALSKTGFKLWMISVAVVLFLLLDLTVAIGLDRREISTAERLPIKSSSRPEGESPKKVREASCRESLKPAKRQGMNDKSKHRDRKDDWSSSDDEDGDEKDSPHKNGHISATYFVNWAIYARSHFPWQVPMDSVTHVFYAFANVRPESGEVYLTDSWADEQIHWADRGDSWNDQGNNLYGCFNQFRQLKEKHRSLKLLLSIGGWTYSSNFAPATDSPEKRAKFSSSALKLLEDYGLDGLDIDWEYPTSDKEADQLVQLLKHMRKDLNSHQKSKNDKTPYLLTIAAPCGPQHFRQLHLKQMSQYISFINLMAYDYAGSWDTIAGHQANLILPDGVSVNQGNFSTVSAVNYYLEQSVPSQKLVIGMPLYGRSFLNTKGIGHPYNGVGPGDWESGIYDYKKLPKKNCKLIEDKKAVAAYTYDKSVEELITFDTPGTVTMKVNYVKSKNLGGVMWWESSGDKDTPGHALIPFAASKLGSLDTTQNHLMYPGSKWDNLKSKARSHSTSLHKKIQHSSHQSHHRHQNRHHINTNVDAGC